MISEKRKEILRVIKFVLFSVSAGIIEIVSFTLADAAYRLAVLASAT